MIALFFLSFFICLGVFIFDNWNDGYDLEIRNLLEMLIVAMVPIINVLFALVLLIKYFYKKYGPDLTKPLLRGKVK